MNCTKANRINLTFMWRHSPHHTHARGGEISDLIKLEISPYVEKLQISPYLSHLEISPHDKFLYRYIGGIVDKYEVCSTWPLTVSRFALFFVLVFAILHVSCDAANALILPCFA